MALKVVWGHVNNRLAVDALVNALVTAVDGTLYLGYPVLPQADSTTTVEALLVSKENGLVAINFPLGTDITTLQQEQDSLAYAVEGNLQKHESLRERRKLAVTVHTMSFFATPQASLRSDSIYSFASPENIEEIIAGFEPISEKFYRPLCAAIERVTNIKPVKKRDNVQKSQSRGSVLKNIERQIANLDEWQRRAAIETPEGPQRVRGLAGSGKTVVLALKAAYLHSQHPDWQICITFHTRSLIQQIKELIDRFVFEHSGGEKPDWTKIHVMHSWGTYGDPGIYSAISKVLNIVPLDFGAAKLKYGRAHAFAGACGELLPFAEKTPPNLFDAILIDEAQDLPVEFIRLIYAATKEPKRIVWAYDELQSLSSTFMIPVKDLFQGKVSVQNMPNAPQQDIILPVCYRNTPWALTLAHALGFGLYREEGIVQLFDELDIWKDIGYKVESGALNFDSNVVLKRRDDSYPNFFNEHLIPEDAVIVKKFENVVFQYEWIAEEIKKNISEDELDPDDILIIFPDAYYAQSNYHELAKSLNRRGIQSHLAGVSSMRDVFNIPGSVAVSGIYRAKGNEAPMVYIANSNFCATSAPNEMVSLRNILFTAITRSRAWIRICGCGDKMNILCSEIDKVRINNYQLKFHIPTEIELKRIKLINRDISEEEKNEIRKAEKDIAKISKLIQTGKIGTDNTQIQELKQLLDKIDGSEQEK